MAEMIVEPKDYGCLMIVRANQMFIDDTIMEP